MRLSIHRASKEKDPGGLPLRADYRSIDLRSSEASLHLTAPSAKQFCIIAIDAPLPPSIFNVAKQ